MCFRKLLGIGLLALGSFLFFAPDVSTLVQKREAQKEIRSFQTKYQKSEKGKTYEKVMIYNQTIYRRDQSGLKDAWSYETVPVSLHGIKGCFGYLKIPKIEVKLPLYLGASKEHMKKGAAILGQTSLPIGGENTNCVIAGHRGFQGIPYFREIEKLKINDKVFVTNPWKTLTYRVETIKVIKPSDVEEIKIQSGKDMVTLLTCHPYRTHGKYRYVVYCVRDRGQNLKTVEISSKGDPFKSSKWDIQRERMLRYGGMAFLFFVGMRTITKKEER